MRGLARERGEVAEKLRSRHGLQAYEVVSADAWRATLRATHCELTIDVDVGAELGVLLLRLAGYHVERCGVPSGTEYLVRERSVMITTCAICGQHVGRSRIEGFTGWEGPEGEVLGREVVVVVHKECYMRLAPAARDGLLEDRARDER